MLTMAPTEAAIIRCLGAPGALDGLPTPPGAYAGRVAPDEVMLLGAHEARAAILAHAAASLAQADPHGLVVDATDGWSVWTISGPEVQRAFAALTAIPFPDDTGAFLQGVIAEVPAKALVFGMRVHVMVASTVGHLLRERIERACSDLPFRTEPSAPMRFEAGTERPE